MHIHTLITGSFEENCIIVGRDDGTALIVDPGADAQRILAKLAQLELRPAAIALTHGHFDHVGAIPTLLADHPELKVYVHPLDVMMLDHPLNRYPPDYPGIARPTHLEDARKLEGVTVIETPGHTPGGVAYYLPQLCTLLSGDTLFAGSVGRTDLPGGDMPTLLASLKQLAALPDDTQVIPGHGPATTIGNEKANNPYLQLG